MPTTLASAYEIIEEFNRKIDAAGKYRSVSYLANIKAGKIKEPLTRRKQGLEEWLQLNKRKERAG